MVYCQLPIIFKKLFLNQNHIVDDSLNFYFDYDYVFKDCFETNTEVKKGFDYASFIYAMIYLLKTYSVKRFIPYYAYMYYSK